MIYEDLDELIDRRRNRKAIEPELEPIDWHETPLAVFLHGRIADEALNGKRETRFLKIRDNGG